MTTYLECAKPGCTKPATTFVGVVKCCRPHAREWAQPSDTFAKTHYQYEESYK